MLAAILFCGAITTSCSKDDDEKNSPTPTPEPETAKSYKVTLDMVIHEKALDMMTVDFIYTDADGKENTMKIDKNTAANAQLTELEKKFFNSDPTLALYKNEDNHPGITDYLSTKYLKVYRVTLDNVATGKTIKTTAKSYILDSYQPNETNNYVLVPIVIPTREGQNDSFMASLSFVMYFYRADNWERLKDKLNGKEIAACMNTLVIQ
jgi:hypothetical protein